MSKLLVLASVLFFSVSSWALIETGDINCGGAKQKFEVSTFFDLDTSKLMATVRDEVPGVGEPNLDGFAIDVCMVRQACKGVEVKDDGQVVFPSDKKLIPPLRDKGEFLTAEEILDLPESVKHDIHTQVVSDCAVIITSNANDDDYINDVWGISQQYGFND